MEEVGDLSRAYGEARMGVEQGNRIEREKSGRPPSSLAGAAGAQAVATVLCRNAFDEGWAGCDSPCFCSETVSERGHSAQSPGALTLTPVLFPVPHAVFQPKGAILDVARVKDGPTNSRGGRTSVLRATERLLGFLPHEL